VQIPAGAQVIDLSNATVMPGLIDHHLHLLNTVGGPSDQNDAGFVVRGMGLAMQNLIGGYTTVVDMGQDTWALLEMRNGINRGWIPGPRIQMAGPALNPRANSGYVAPELVYAVPSRSGQRSAGRQRLVSERSADRPMGGT
jgi:imidazolonepropionase-like amidohydrolase